MVNFLSLYPSFTELSIILVHSVNPTLNYYIHYPKAQTFLNKRFPAYKEIYIVTSLLCLIFHYFTSRINIPVLHRRETKTLNVV